MAIWREQDLLEPTARQSWHYSLLPKHRLGICQYTSNMFDTLLRGSAVSESRFKHHISTFESKVLDTARSCDDYVLAIATCIAAVDNGAQQCQMHLSMFIEDLLSSDQIISSRQPTEQAVAYPQNLLNGTETGKHRRNLYSVLNEDYPPCRLQENSGIAPVDETHLVAETSLPEIWFMSDDQRQQLQEQERKKHEQERQEQVRKKEQKEKLQRKQEQQYHQPQDYKSESLMCQNDEYQNELHKQQQQESHHQLDLQEQPAQQHVNTIEPTASVPTCSFTQTQKATATRIEMEEQAQPPPTIGANTNELGSEPAIALDWRKQLPRDERIKVCLHIYSKTKPYYNHMSDDQLKNCIRVYEAQTYEGSKSRQAYLNTIAGFLSKVKQRHNGTEGKP